MDRRSFLNNSIGALLFAGLSSNKVLAEVVETLTPDSPKVLLYLIQTNSGEWKVKATKWVDLYRQKRLKRCEVKKETFKALDIVDYELATKRKYELWKEYNCSGRLTPVNILENVKNGKKAIASEKYIDYRNSDRLIENLRKRNEAAAYAIRNMDDSLRKYRGEIARKYITGRKHNEQTIEILKEKFKGRPSSMKGKKHSEESKNKMSEKAKGRPSHMKGKTWSEEVRRNMSLGGKGKKMTESFKEKMRVRMLTNNPFKGKKHTHESLTKMKEKHPSKIKKVCEYCNKELDLVNYNRYHGDKCIKITGVSTVSEEQKQKTRNKLKGRTSGKFVICYSYPNMDYIKEYDNLTTATNELKLNRECARLTCVGKRNHIGGFTFRYKD